MTRPKANMLDMRVYIVPQHIWDTVPGQAVNGYENGAPLAGSGPFQLTSYKPAGDAVMTANKNYWGGAPKIDELDFVYYQNPDTMVSDLTSGSLQGAWSLSEAQYRELQNSSTFKPLAYRLASCRTSSGAISSVGSSTSTTLPRDRVFAPHGSRLAR